MERRRRLSGDKLFAAIGRDGKRWYNPVLGLKALPNKNGISRYAFRVGKHIGKAVVRNRVKRLMREASRSTPVLEGWDLLFNARAGAKASDYWQIKSAVEDLLAKARILANRKQKGDVKDQ